MGYLILENPSKILDSFPYPYLCLGKITKRDLFIIHFCIGVK